VIGSLADHCFRSLSYRYYAFCRDIHSNNGGLVYHYAFSFYADKCICGTKINPYIFIEKHMALFLFKTASIKLLKNNPPEQAAVKRNELRRQAKFTAKSAAPAREKILAALPPRLIAVIAVAVSPDLQAPPGRLKEYPRGKPALPRLYNTSLAQADETAVADDQVINHLNAEKLSRVPKPFRDGNIRFARLRIAAGMIMHERDGSGASFHSGSEHLARVYDGAVYVAHRYFFYEHNFFFYVEQKDFKAFFFQVTHVFHKQRRYFLRRTYIDPSGSGFRRDPLA
jgi:hypothetical protein